MENDMSQQANQNLWDADLTAHLDPVGATPDTGNLRVDDVVAVLPIDPKKSVGKYRYSRKALDEANRGAQHEDHTRAAGNLPPQRFVRTEGTKQITTIEVAPPAATWDLKDGDRNQVTDDMMESEAVILKDQLAQKIVKVVNGLFVPANFPGRTSTMALLPGGDQKDLSDPDHNPNKSLIVARNLARQGNADMPPDQMTVSEAWLEAYRLHPGMLAKLGNNKAKDYIPQDEAIDRLEQALGLRVCVKKWRGVWASKVLFHYRGGKEITDAIHPTTGETYSYRKGGYMHTRGTDRVEKLRMATAVLWMEQIAALGTNMSGDPATWGVQVYQPNDFALSVRCMASVDATIVDPHAGWLVTDGY